MTEEERRRLRHDMRQPLVIITGFAQLLAGDDDLDAATRRDYARRIEAAARELADLVERA